MDQFKFPKSDDWAPFCNIHRGVAKKMFEIEREIDARDQNICSR